MWNVSIMYTHTHTHTLMNIHVHSTIHTWHTHTLMHTHTHIHTRTHSFTLNYAGTTTTKLNVDKHLDKLLNKTSDKVSPYWKEVGNKLGFKDDTLGKIPRELALRSERDYYVSMIRKWMNWAPPKHDFATLEALVKAMRDTDIDELMMPAYDLENSKSEFK